MNRINFIDLLTTWLDHLTVDRHQTEPNVTNDVILEVDLMRTVTTVDNQRKKCIQIMGTKEKIDVISESKDSKEDHNHNSKRNKQSK